MASSVTLAGAFKPDVDAINLRNVLLRLEQKILLSDSSSRISSTNPLQSSFELDKTAQNLEYARTLLLRIQHNAANAKLPQARRHAQQTELGRQRALIKRLTERLYELRRQGDNSDEEVNGVEVLSEEAESGEDLLAKYFPPEPSPVKEVQAEETVSSNGLRSRNVNPPSPAQTPSSQPPAPTGSSTSTGNSVIQREQLFGNINTKSKPKSAQSPNNTFSPSDDITLEKQLVHQDATQAEITSALVSLATQLKTSSLAFAEELALDAEAVGRTEGALGRNQQSLESASRGMGALRKMTEGRWWWQRYIMFILIAVAWVVQIVIVFFSPKIRL